MNKKIIHFDTIDSVSTYDNNFQCYNNAFNANIKINSPLHKVKRVSLKSVEMPIYFSPIRSSNSSNVLFLQFSYSTYTNIQIPIYIPSGSYSNLSSLISLINSQLSGYLVGYTGLIMYAKIITNVAGGYSSVQFVSNSSTTYYFYQDSLLLSSILGISQTQRSFVEIIGATITGSSPVNLNLDNYVCMYISNFSSSSANASGRNCSFKIPMTVLNFQILFYGDNNQMTQFIDITETNFTLDRISVSIYDRFGFPINNFDGNYSFSLFVEYDSLY